MKEGVHTVAEEAPVIAAQSAANKTICAFGCARASVCDGRCQPGPLKPCKWCAEGWERRDGQHWIVTSLRRPTIEIRDCTR